MCKIHILELLKVKIGNQFIKPDMHAMLKKYLVQCSFFLIVYMVSVTKYMSKQDRCTAAGIYAGMCVGIYTCRYSRPSIIQTPLHGHNKFLYIGVRISEIQSCLGYPTQFVAKILVG